MPGRYDILEQMRGRIAVAALAAAMAGALGACGSDGGVDPGSDSGVPGDDAGPDTTTSDADLPDSADANVDAPTDAKTDAKIDAGPSFCSTLSPAPKFCDDFDDGDAANAWNTQTVLGGSVLDVDNVTYASAPYSLGIATPPLLNMQSAAALLRKTLFGTAKHSTLSFSTYFMTSPVVTKGSLAIATLDVSLDHFFTLHLRDSPQDGVSLPAAVLEEIEGSTITRFPLSSVPPMSAWTRVVIDIDLNAAKANVTIGGTKVVDNVTIGTTGGTEATVRLGAIYLFGPADPVEARFDDVVIDF